MYLRTQSHRPPAPGYGEVIEAIGLGVAVFQTGQSILTSGDFSSESSTVNYIHERTPASQSFRRCTTEFRLRAHHPRLGIGTQNFWFRLSFEYNGNDVRNAAIVALVDRSSSLYSSTFSVRFVGQAYSVPSAPVAEVLFQINGRWNPVGRGDVSFWGELKVRADGRVTLSISSERNWVSADPVPGSCTRVAPYAPPTPRPPAVVPIFYYVFFSPPGSDRVREGDEQRLAQFYQRLPAPLRASIERGETPIKVEGFASTTQPGPANLELSRRRAERVVRILRDLAGTSARFQVFALGEYRAGTPDRVEAPNERRVQITINYTVPGTGSGGVQGVGLDGLPCFYGRWCGPGCSGPGAPTDDLDTCCQTHDRCYSRGGYFNCDCDRALVNCVAPMRDWRTAKGRAALAVWRYFTVAPCRGGRT